MEILGLVWLGSRTAEYQRMRDFVANVLELDVLPSGLPRAMTGRARI